MFVHELGREYGLNIYIPYISERYSCLKADFLSTESILMLIHYSGIVACSTYHLFSVHGYSQSGHFRKSCIDISTKLSTSTSSSCTLTHGVAVILKDTKCLLTLSVENLIHSQYLETALDRLLLF